MNMMALVYSLIIINENRPIWFQDKSPSNRSTKNTSGEWKKHFWSCVSDSIYVPHPAPDWQLKSPPAPWGAVFYDITPSPPCGAAYEPVVKTTTEMWPQLTPFHPNTRVYQNKIYTGLWVLNIKLSTHSPVYILCLLYHTMVVGHNRQFYATQGWIARN